MHNQNKIELLQAEIDEDDDSFFRFLINGQTIKYITIKTGVYSLEDMCFGPTLTSILPEFPAGDWNDGLIAKNPNNGEPCFARAVRTDFPSMKHQWHGTYVDYLDLKFGEKLRTGIYEATCSQFGTTAVIAKFARFEWEIQYLENETTAYEWIHGYDIGPQFLGHPTEDGRVIGFLMERLSGAHHAGPNDLAACQDVLQRLHMLNIHHGDTNRFNFLLRGSKAVLIDFDSARKRDDPKQLQTEFDNLSTCLQDTSRAGGGGLLV